MRLAVFVFTCAWFESSSEVNAIRRMTTTKLTIEMNEKAEVQPVLSSKNQKGTAERPRLVANVCVETSVACLRLWLRDTNH